MRHLYTFQQINIQASLRDLDILVSNVQQDQKQQKTRFRVQYKKKRN